MFCKNCGAYCEDQAAFCSVCGCDLWEQQTSGENQNTAYDYGSQPGQWGGSGTQAPQYGGSYGQPDSRNAGAGGSGNAPRGNGGYQTEQYGGGYQAPQYGGGYQTEQYGGGYGQYRRRNEAPEEPEDYEEDEESRGMKKTTIVAIILAVLLVIVIAAIAVVVISKSGSAAAEAAQEEEAQNTRTAEISAFTVDSCNATAVVLTIDGSGSQPEGWRIILTPESGAAITKETTERSVVIDGLTPETGYTAVLKTTDNTVLTGTTECSFTTGAYTVLTAFQADSVTSDQATLSWSYDGTQPASWTVTWNGSDGSSDTLETADTTCTLTGLTVGVSYSVVLACDSLRSTELATISVVPELIAVSSWNIIDLSSTSVSVSWNYSGTTATPGAWVLSYTYGEDMEPVTVDCSSNNGVIVNDLLPNTAYTFTVTAADGEAVAGEEKVYTTSDGGTFSEYGCRNVEMTLYALDNEGDSLGDPTTVLSTAQLLGYMIEATYNTSSADKSVETIYIIRKANGEPLYSYSSSRTWNGDWELANHTGTFPDHITEPGVYTLEAYFNGAFMASKTFTVE